MAQSFLKRIEWENIADEANASMQSDIDRVSRAASWDSVPGWDAVPTWSNLSDTPEMWIMKVKASWGAVGCSDEQILAEAKRLFQESKHP